MWLEPCKVPKLEVAFDKCAQESPAAASTASAATAVGQQIA